MTKTAPTHQLDGYTSKNTHPLDSASFTDAKDDLNISPHLLLLIAIPRNLETVTENKFQVMNN